MKILLSVCSFYCSFWLFRNYIQSSPDLPCFSGESKNARYIGSTVNRGKVNTCSIVKHDIGEQKKARYIEGHGKSGPGKSGDYCI